MLAVLKQMRTLQRAPPLRGSVWICRLTPRRWLWQCRAAIARDDGLAIVEVRMWRSDASTGDSAFRGSRSARDRPDARHGPAVGSRRAHRAAAEFRTESAPELRLRDAEWWPAGRVEFRSGLERRSTGRAFGPRELSARTRCGYLGPDGAVEGRNVPAQRVDQERWPWQWLDERGPADARFSAGRHQCLAALGGHQRDQRLAALMPPGRKSSVSRAPL